MVGALGAAICARDMVRSGKAKDKRGVRS
jgi:hypothetical protein